MITFIQRSMERSKTISDLIGKSHHFIALASRCYIAQVFFSAGLTKLKDWDTTLFLFEEEYQVPILAPDIAAYLGTFGEVFFPLLLLFGLGTRISAFGLSVVNVVAVVSLESIAPAAFYLHIIWGVLLAQLVVYGGGQASIDHLLVKSQQSTIRVLP